MSLEDFSFFESVKNSWNKISSTIKLSEKKEKLSELSSELEKQSSYSEKVIEMQKEINRLEKEISEYELIQNEIQNTSEFLEMIDDLNQSEKDEISANIIKISKLVKDFEIKSLFKDKDDSSNCFLEINSGAGGTDAQDWVAILYRMYQMYCDKKGFEIDIIDEDVGEEAGFKSVTLHVKGNLAYGFLKNEIGIHRLVRISPFNANDKRQTSFAGIYVYPEINRNINIEIADKDLKIDAMRSGGAGGQHVNKTESAIRITHIPTGIVVKSQSSRSQIQNRELAMRALKSKLYELELKKQNQEKNSSESQKSDISFGNQIRNYVMHPYQIVKDLRSNWETSNIQKILDGELDEIIESVLMIEK